MIFVLNLIFFCDFIIVFRIDVVIFLSKIVLNLNKIAVRDPLSRSAVSEAGMLTIASLALMFTAATKSSSLGFWIDH